MTTWNIHNSDGHYLGQAKAIHPKVALHLYLIINGITADLQDMECTEKDDGTFDLIFDGVVYRLAVLSQNPFV